MSAKKVTLQDLKKIVGGLEKDSEQSIGIYFFKKYRIQISKYKSSGTERYMRLYKNRRAQGRCIRCGKKIIRRNPLTGTLYRLCDYHRQITDRKKR